MSKFHLYYFGCLAGLTLLPLAQAATDCSAVTQIPPTECEVLLDFYNSTGGANWRDNTGWNETNTPCEWKGVSCNEGQVISLVLVGWVERVRNVGFRCAPPNLRATRYLTRIAL